jgi:2'-5' RNA ligase
MRPLAVELAFDQASDQRLGRVWSSLLGLYDGPRGSELGVRPHITLALFRSGEPRNVADLIQSLAEELAPFDLKLAAADRFPTSEGAVFLRPEPSRELTRAHAILHELLGADRGLVHAYYRPPAWSPHCTMAINVAEPCIDAVLSECSQALGEVRVARIQLVRYRPATEIAGALLGQRKTV